MCAFWTKKSKEADADKLQREHVSNIISEIQHQRSKIQIAFEEGLTGIKNLTASLVHVDVEGLALEVSALKSASRSWLGANITCYFRVRDTQPGGISQFLTFTSRILTIRLQPNGMVCFVVERPRSISSAQQRRCVRINVDSRRVPAVAVWRSLPSGANIAEIPPLLNSEGAAGGRFKVSNLSSTGLRLVVQNSLMRETLPTLEKKELFTFYFKAIAEPGDPEQAFWVNAMVRNVFNDPQQSETSLGFEFDAQGLLDEEERLIWQPLKSGELTDLGPFIFKWNLLDFHREKRVDA